MKLQGGPRLTRTRILSSTSVLIPSFSSFPGVTSPVSHPCRDLSRGVVRHRLPVFPLAQGTFSLDFPVPCPSGRSPLVPGPDWRHNLSTMVPTNGIHF